MDNTALYAPAIAEAVKIIARRMSRRCDWTTEPDELFAVAQHAIMKQLPKYDAVKHPDFEWWACSRATWGIKTFQRNIDFVPRRVRAEGVTHNPMIYLDMPRRFDDDSTGLLDHMGFVTEADRSEEADDVAHLNRGLKRLDRRYRAAIQMYYLDGMGKIAIADKLSCSRETIKVWIDLGLIQMRLKMERSPLPLAA